MDLLLSALSTEMGDIQIRKIRKSSTPAGFTVYLDLLTDLILRAFSIIIHLFQRNLDLMSLRRDICMNSRGQIFFGGGI
jgi:hypothetical protein